MSASYTMGIDIGSTASKCIILKDGTDIVSKALVPFGTGTSGPGRVVKQALDEGNLARKGIAFTLATGYGRNSIEDKDHEMSELSCHARGAYQLFPDARTVIDIGGQDVKILRVGENGALENFAMNDKCAAGTGRFLEVMARVLEVSIEDLEKLSAESTERVDISSTCTVFAESEVISQLAQKKDRRDIIRGIHRSVAMRVAGLAKRVGVREAVIMTGGVARNGGVVQAMQEELGLPIKTSPISQYVGALGAAIFGFQKMKKEN